PAEVLATADQEPVARGPGRRELRPPGLDCLEGQRRDRQGRGQGPANPLAGERLDVAGSVADEEETLGRELSGASGQADRPPPPGVLQRGDHGQTGLAENLGSGVCDPTAIPEGVAIERSGQVQLAGFDPDQADITTATDSHEDRAFAVDAGEVVD